MSSIDVCGVCAVAVCCCFSFTFISFCASLNQLIPLENGCECDNCQSPLSNALSAIWSVLWHRHTKNSDMHFFCQKKKIFYFAASMEFRLSIKFINWTIINIHKDTYGLRFMGISSMFLFIFNINWIYLYSQMARSMLINEENGMEKKSSHKRIVFCMYFYPHRDKTKRLHTHHECPLAIVYIQ